MGEMVAECYLMISEYYEGKFAERSGVPYMNHIDEGLSLIHISEPTRPY